MKSIQEAQDSILSDIPQKDWDIAKGIQKELFEVWSTDEGNFTEHVERIRKDIIEKHKNIVYSSFHFQIDNGHLYDGSFEIAIHNNVAKIAQHRITPAVKLMIDAHGGQEIAERPEPITFTAKPKSKKEEVAK